MTTTHTDQLTQSTEGGAGRRLTHQHHLLPGVSGRGDCRRPLLAGRGRLTRSRSLASPAAGAASTHPGSRGRAAVSPMPCRVLAVSCAVARRRAAARPVRDCGSPTGPPPPPRQTDRRGNAVLSRALSKEFRLRGKSGHWRTTFA